MSMKEIEEAIARLHDTPCLKPDWDDAGAQPVAISTLDASTALLRAMSVQWPAASVMRAPVMGPCPDGSVDLHWTNPKLLINVNSEGDADFYFEGGRSGCSGMAYIGTEANLLYWAHAFAHLASMVDLGSVTPPNADRQNAP